MRYSLAVVSVALFTLSSFAQDGEKVDSLTTLIKGEPNESKKHHHLVRLAKLYIHTNRAKSDSIATIALLYAEKNEDIQLQSEALSLLAFVNYKDEKDEIALRYYKKLDSILLAENIKNELLIKSKLYQSQIAKFTYTEEGLHRAKGYLDEMLEISKEIGSAHYEHLAYLNIGGWYGVLAQVENPEKNLEICEGFQLKALNYFLDAHDTVNISKAYWFMSNLGLARGNLASAEKYMIKRLEVLKASKDSLEMANAYSGMAAFNYKVLKNFSKAILFYDTASMIYNIKGYPNSEMRLRLLNGYAISHKAEGAYEKAFSYLDRAYMLKDSLDRNRSRVATVEMETKYQTEKKEQEIALLTTQNQLAEQEKQNQLYLLLGIVLIVLIAAIFFFILYRNRQKTTTKLQELDALKSNFFANISHEFRTPLTLIKGPLQKQLSQGHIEDGERENLEMINRNTDRLLALVDQLLDLSKLESGTLTLHVEKASLSAFTEVITAPFQYLAEQKDIQFATSIAEADNAYFDKDVLEKVVANLLSNAVKYTPAGGSIQYQQFVSDGWAVIEVKNTGEGIPKEEQQKIFDRFYQMNEPREGVGIGLALVKELVMLHKGSVRLAGDASEYTCFEVKLPVVDTAYTSAEMVSDEKPAQERPLREEVMRAVNKVEEDTIATEKPIMLIVDDSADLRKLIKGLFSASYSILLAENGEDGISKAIEHVPDIIVSDVMMPVKDGVELSQTLKADERTSHIPIILLTAKAGQENELKGLETGADEYMVKPFNNDILKVRVEKLIELRAHLRARYSQEVILRPKDIAITSVDEKFLDKAQLIINTHITRSDFTAEFFSKEIGMSRMQLHRKIKALIGLSTSEFIRSQRLKMAAQLLGSSDVNISEAGYAVGFNDPSYFAKCFKEVYGSTPTHYASEAKAKS